MDSSFNEAYFINAGIEYGIRSYLEYRENNIIDEKHRFEMYVIKTLTIIYGEKSILLPYKIDNEKAFECNLLIYNLKENDMYRFLKLMGEYDNFMCEYNSNAKAMGFIFEIEKILMDMIQKRSKKKEFTSEEINEFETIFNPVNGDFSKIEVMFKNNEGLITRFWEDKKDELTNTQIRMMAVNPNLLNPNLYARFGLDVSEVAKLSEKEIDDINKKIQDEENRVLNYTNIGKRTRRRKVILSSGNGFVDAMVILSVIATEIMLGIVTLAYIGGYLWK